MLRMSVQDVKFPNELARHISLGFNYTNSRDPNKLREGLNLLTSADTIFYTPIVFDKIYALGHRKEYRDQVRSFFTEKQRNLKVEFLRPKQRAAGTPTEAHSTIKLGASKISSPPRTNKQPREAPMRSLA